MKSFTPRWKSGRNHLPSGNIALENGPFIKFIVDLPIQTWLNMVIFHSFLYLYQAEYMTSQLGPVLAGKDWLRLPLTLNFGEASDHLDGTEDQLGRPSELMTSTNWVGNEKSCFFAV